MKYTVDGWNNFCRIFELPEHYPQGYCFGGGKPVNFQMVDWFNPVQGIPQPAVSKEIWREKVGEIKTKETDENELRETLLPWVMKKNYLKPGRKYLILFDFGAAITFTAAPSQQEEK